MLFVELTLIRWAGANIYYLFAFTNFVLIASFLGMGIGFLRAKSSTHYFSFAPIFLVIFIFFCYKFSYEYHPIVDLQTDNLDYKGSYFKENAYPIWVTLPLVFLSVTILMASIAEGVARAFQSFPPLTAYRLEIIGSLLGILSFTALSFFHASPIYWGMIISLLFISLLLPQWQWRAKSVFLMVLQLIALAGVVGIFAKETNAPGHIWSSYYKIDLKEYAKQRYVVDVNGLAQQVIESVKQREKVKPFYLLPYQHAQHAVLNNVLIIGAGTGGDVAIALSQGAKHIDAVEIDPTLYRLGKKYNPNHPYDDARVHVVINDGRAFLQQTHRSYDLIIFALTDSLFLLPGQSSMRLENYLYTMESIAKTKQHLAPGGTFAIYNYYAERWLVDRLANTISSVYQHAPCLDTFSSKDYWATVLTVSASQATLQCPSLWKMEQQEYATPSTDDHPFLYLMNNQLPFSNSVTLLFMFFSAVVLVLAGVGKSYRALGTYLDLFFMGAAFLLLETKSVVNYALLFGSTWLVNALVFIGVLFSVYLATECIHSTYLRPKPKTLYQLLFLTLLISWSVPNSWLLSLPVILRLLLETALVFSPIFIANLIFAERFRHSASSTEAFGINLMGAVLGGLLEYCSLIVGYHQLLILIGILYFIAIVLMRQKQKLVLADIN